MSTYFPDYDGQWSSQTKRAAQELGTKGLELNSNWALERQHWSCPGCGRSKAEIFRKSSSGILLAKLELHHDHLWEEASCRPAKLLGPEWKVVLAEGAAFVVENIRALLVRFEDSLICSECNAADGKAKRILETDPRFSFAAAEIRTFVKAVRNQDHIVDVEAARKVWEVERPGLERRVALLDTLMDDLVAGHLQRRREGAVPAGRPLLSRVGTGELLRQAFWKSARNTENYGNLYRMRAGFLARSVRKDTVRRERGKAEVRVPTEKEYLGYLPKTAPQRWIEKADDWICPCCGRGKRTSMRISSKMKWSGAIRCIAQYEILLDSDEIILRERLFPTFPNDLHLKEMVWVDVCSDCADVMPRIKQTRRDLADIHLTIEQIKRVLVLVEDHIPHEIDFDLAAELSNENWRYGPAAEAMSAFMQIRTDFRTLMKVATENRDLRTEVFKRLDFELKVERGIENPQERKEIMGMLKNGTTP